MMEDIELVDRFPRFRANYNGEGLFVGHVWQVYKRNMANDTEQSVCYERYEPLGNVLYKSEEACLAAIDGICQGER